MRLMQGIVVIFALFVAVESLSLKLRAPSKEARRKWVLTEDESPEPRIGADFYFGSDQQHTALMLDFNTPNTWVVQKGCTTNLCDMGTLGMDPTTSPTFVNTTLPFSASYSTELGKTYHVTGYVAKDTLQLSSNRSFFNPSGACCTTSPYTWTGAFGLVTKSNINQTLGNWPTDGCLGLAPGGSDVMEPAIRHFLPKSIHQVVTLWMHEDGAEIVGAFIPGGYDFDYYGNCDNTSYTATSITEGNTWKFAVTKAELGSVSRVLREEAEVDGQSMLTGVPSSFYSSVVKAFNAADDGGKLLAVDCKQQFPNFTLTVSGKPVTVTSKAYISRNTNWHESGKCRLLMYPVVSSGFTPSWKISYMWFYDICLHLNLDTLKIGFSNQTWL